MSEGKLTSKDAAKRVYSLSAEAGDTYSLNSALAAKQL